MTFADDAEWEDESPPAPPPPTRGFGTRVVAGSPRLVTDERTGERGLVELVEDAAGALSPPLEAAADALAGVGAERLGAHARKVAAAARKIEDGARFVQTAAEGARLVGRKTKPAVERLRAMLRKLGEIARERHVVGPRATGRTGRRGQGRRVA